MAVPRVIIAGAGLGGLCLAQGLRQAGIDVAIHERDAAIDARPQGYRLHIDGRGAVGLHACLPPERYDLVLATSGAPSTQLTVLTTRLRQLKVMRFEGAASDAPEALNTSVDRQVLREILLAGLEDVVHFGHAIVGYDLAGDRVRVRLGDGTTDEGDLLVGADGVGSTVRRQLVPDAVVAETGEFCIYGRTTLTPEIAGVIPEQLRNGFVAVVGLRGLGMALGMVDFRTPPEEAVRLTPGVALTAREPYVMWALSGEARAFGEGEVDAMTGPELHARAMRLIGNWHPRLQELVAAAEPDACFPVRIRVAQPVTPWETGPVTLLGDAIHVMSPARGSGANIALKDAGRLRDAIVTAVTGETSLRDAVAGYEREMLQYGFAAVGDSLAVARQGNGPLARILRLLRGNRA
ncbi:MAG TPA: NAD(P)/FAD-dependent oxidoreductase [Thermomicrobiales bacterium]|nr:NAD(P)/FAD-dependent oxidoreductase [Thermomicrobiales bacterium]